MVSVVGGFLSSNMDPNNTAELYRYLEKQAELLRDTKRTMEHELERLQVEEEMLMRKFFDFMETLGFTKKSMVGDYASKDGEEEASKALAVMKNDLQ